MESSSSVLAVELYCGCSINSPWRYTLASFQEELHNQNNHHSVMHTFFHRALCNPCLPLSPCNDNINVGEPLKTVLFSKDCLQFLVSKLPQFVWKNGCGHCLVKLCLLVTHSLGAYVRIDR